MITLSEYMMGRDVSHALECSPDILRNAARTVELANALLVLAKGGNVKIIPKPDGTMTNSGWRPPSINASTPGASKTSMHMTGEAIDLFDPEGRIDTWCTQVSGTVLKDLGLWLESPASTPRWCHVQIRPPRSGNRVFSP